MNSFITTLKRAREMYSVASLKRKTDYILKVAYKL